MEADLEKISGIGAARIRTDQGEISEIHVVADDSRRPKLIVRDVVTTLYARHGIRVPHQRISVAGTASPAAVTPAAASEPEAPWRLRLTGVHLAREGDRLLSTVELRDGERSQRASADAPATRANHLWVVAEATLEGVRLLTGEVATFDLQEIRRVNLGRLPVVLAHVVLLQAGSERSLVGSCLDRQGRLDAPAGAVLDAVNRVLLSFRSREEEIEYEVGEDGMK
jgi:hypothetical protein